MQLLVYKNDFAGWTLLQTKGALVNWIKPFSSHPWQSVWQFKVSHWSKPLLLTGNWASVKAYFRYFSQRFQHHIPGSTVSIYLPCRGGWLRLGSCFNIVMAFWLVTIKTIIVKHKICFCLFPRIRKMTHFYIYKFWNTTHKSDNFTF